MGNGGVAALPPQRGGPHEGSTGGNEFARGLMLVRASALKMARLQVAIESRDRRLVLQTMDDLVSLDGEMRDLVDQIPRSDPDIDVLQVELDQQRRALAREKLVLVGGISRREQSKFADETRIVANSTSSAVHTAEISVTDLTELADCHAEFLPSEDYSIVSPAREPRNWSVPVLALAIVVFLFGAVAVAVLLFGTDDPQASIRGLLQVLGG